jgi:putative ABC transport system permease protein
VTWHREVWRRALALVGRRRLDRELEDELETHLECSAADYMARGLSPNEARNAALRDFGGVARTKDAYRDVRGFPLIESLVQDTRFALRVLRKSPVFTTVAVLTLALGIGANGAIFGVADALLARPLPGLETDRLAVVVIGQKGPAAAADFLDWRRLNTSFTELAAYRQRDVNLTGAGAAERVFAAQTTSNFFTTLGLNAALGRAFVAQDERADAPVAVLTYGYWHRRFGGDTAIVGRSIDLDGRPHTVVGVMPPDVEMPMPTDVWMPLALTPAERARRDILTLRVVGRLKPESTLEQAKAEFDAIARRLEASFPATNRNRRTHVMPLTEFVQGTILRSTLFFLLGCVGVVLAIACLNIAGLQVARVASRARERDLRTALGASRWRIVQLVIVENVVIAAIGGVVGALVASGCLSLLLRSMPADIVRLIPGFARIRVDGRGLAFMAAVTLASGIFSGVVPAIVSPRRRLVSAGPRQRIRSVFVVSQIAVAVVMLVTGWLFVQGQRSLLRHHEVPEPERVVVLSVNLPAARYPDAGARSRFYDAALQRLASAPGVVSAAVCTTLPLSNNGTTWARVDVEGFSPPPSTPAPAVVQQTVSAEFLQVLGIPLIAGRTFSASDRLDTAPVAMVSETMARRYWPNGDAIGKRVRLRGQTGEPWREIVGIAGNVLYDWTYRVPEAVVYDPIAQAPLVKSSFAIRVAGDAGGSVLSLAAELGQVDPLLPAFGVMSLRDAVAESFAGTAQISAMMNMLAGLAFAIAMIGIYGIVAYTVAARTREFGVRIALGARRADIFRLVMRHAVVISASGVCCGLVGVVAASRVTRSLVFAAGAGTQAMTLAGMAAVVAVAALLACCGPARSATRADPVESLRAD